ncbi:MAG: AAA family ATPase [Solirubrobacteraceae bacterium]
MSAAGVTQDDRVVIWNLRGYRVPLTSDAAAEAAVEWLRANAVTYWIIDPWARICSWSGADENVNAEVGQLLQRVDEIAADAGVEDILVVHHAGHARGRPRGATVLPDWADGIWLYTRDEESDDRYLRAEGRGVALPTGLVEIGEDGRTTYREADPRKGKIHRLIKGIVAYVAANDGCPTSEAQDSLSGSNSLKTNAVSQAVEMGMIRREDDPQDKRRKLLHFVSSEPLDGTEF